MVYLEERWIFQRETRRSNNRTSTM